MRVTARCAFSFHMELGTSSDGTGPILHRESVLGDLGDLVDEAFASAVLSERLPPATSELHVRISPTWGSEPRAEGVRASLSASRGFDDPYVQDFSTGRWMRRAQRLALELSADGDVPEGGSAYVQLLATPQADAELELPVLMPPAVSDEPLEAVGVRRLEAEPLCPDRPVLVDARMVEEILERTESAGASETGGGTLGKIVRLPQPLEGARTRIVTLLTASLADDRHTGELARFTFDPFALAEAGSIADLRGRGETVITGFHTHGWGTGCGRCNHNVDCALPQATLVSLSDYEVLESLFPSKATLMPIAGRRLGADGDRPVLEIHAWRGGQMKSIAWRTYHD